MISPSTWFLKLESRSHSSFLFLSKNHIYSIIKSNEVFLKICLKSIHFPSPSPAAWSWPLSFLNQKLLSSSWIPVTMNTLPSIFNMVVRTSLKKKLSSYLKSFKSFFFFIFFQELLIRLRLKENLYSLIKPFLLSTSARFSPLPLAFWPLWLSHSLVTPSSWSYRAPIDSFCLECSLTLPLPDWLFPCFKKHEFTFQEKLFWWLWIT